LQKELLENDEKQKKEDEEFARKLQKELSNKEKENDHQNELKKKRKLEEEDKSLALAFQLEQEWTKEKKNKVQGMDIIPLPLGVILFKNCLTIDEQIGVYNICDEVRKEKSNMYNSSINSKGFGTQPVPMLMHNWNGKGKNKEVQPTDLLDFGKMMFKKAHKYAIDSNMLKEESNPDYQCPSSYDPDALYAILYSENGKLQSHVDGALGWVLSVSIGNSVLFTISDSQNSKDKITIQLDSGDVILFNGGKIWHAVDKVITNTAPKFWESNVIDTHGYARFNLQFRDPKNFTKRKCLVVF